MIISLRAFILTAIPYDVVDMTHGWNDSNISAFDVTKNSK